MIGAFETVRLRVEPLARWHRAELAAFHPDARPANAASRRVMEKVGLAYERDAEHAGRARVLHRRSAGA